MSQSSEVRSKAAELVTDAISRAIMAGELRGDDPVYEEEWAKTLNVSRTPVREAIQALVAQGLLTRRGRTAFVFRPSLSELFEIYDMRLPLEQLAASRSAEAPTQEFIDDLESAYEKIREPRADPEWHMDHEKFHMRLYEGSQMFRLTALIGSLRAQSEPYIGMAVHLDKDFRERANLQHRAMVDAVKDAEPALVAHIIQDHLQNTRQKISDIVNAAESLAGGWSWSPSLRQR